MPAAEIQIDKENAQGAQNERDKESSTETECKRDSEIKAPGPFDREEIEKKYPVGESLTS